MKIGIIGAGWLGGSGRIWVKAGQQAERLVRISARSQPSIHIQSGYRR